LFPLFYGIEAWILSRFVSTTAAIVFAILILPVSYFTLFYLEWFERNFGGSILTSSRKRQKAHLERFRTRILNELELLAGHLERG
jgi:hypothetical protein